MKVYAALLLALLATGCYRGAPPPPLDEGVAIAITTNHARLVRSQALLQDELAAACSRELGWQVSPVGGARLALLLEPEDIDVVATGDLGIPERWRVTLRGEWRLSATSYGDRTGRFAAHGFYNDRFEETEALRAAAASAAREIVADLRLRLTAAPDADRPRSELPPPR